MKYPSISKNEVSRSLMHILGLTVFALALVLFLYGSVNAQGNPMDSPPLGQSAAGQYKSGETPKNEAAKKKSVRLNDKQETNREGMPNIIERDPRHPHAGSGPDPFGRY
ncbi:MAG: hypothetical protein ABI363_05255 [Nitrosospira sp.]